jgi:hypothetical protein
MDTWTTNSSRQARKLRTRIEPAVRSGAVKASGLSISHATLLFLWAGCSFSPASCYFGGARPDFDLKGIPGTLKFQSENAWAAETVDGRYRLFNNVWNSKAISGPYRQKVFVKEEHDKPAFGWVWSVPDSQAPATYPEIQAGASPWNGAVVPDSGFPFQIGTKELVVSYDINLAASGNYDVTLQSWVVSALRPSKSLITHEVVIFIANERIPVAGERVAQTTLQGNAFSVYVDKYHRDATGNNANTWTLISLLAEKPILRGPVDVGALFDFLLKSGHLDAQSYVANIELGTDIMRGSGSAVIRDFAVTVD